MMFPSLSAIFHVCVPVSWSGKGSCWIDNNSGVDSDPSLRYTNDSMTFVPSLGSRDARCSCDTVDKWNMTYGDGWPYRPYRQAFDKAFHGRGSKLWPNCSRLTGSSNAQLPNRFNAEIILTVSSNGQLPNPCITGTRLTGSSKEKLQNIVLLVSV